VCLVASALLALLTAGRQLSPQCLGVAHEALHLDPERRRLLLERCLVGELLLALCAALAVGLQQLRLTSTNTRKRTHTKYARAARS